MPPSGQVTIAAASASALRVNPTGHAGFRDGRSGAHRRRTGRYSMTLSAERSLHARASRWGLMAAILDGGSALG